MLGSVPRNMNQLTAEQQAQVTSRCLEVNQPPTVSITSPVEGAPLAPSATVTLTAVASDDVSVASVVFSVNGDEQPPLEQPPYSIEITIPTDESSLEIEVLATDGQGLTTTANATFNVSSDPPPTVSITSPEGQASAGRGASESAGGAGRGRGPGDEVTAGSRITISAEASDNGSVVSVVFIVNGGSQAPITEPPYTMEITVPLGNTATATAPLTIQAVATDDLGQTATASVTIPIADDSHVVTITAPAEGSSVREGESIEAEADVSGRISTVQFTFDGESQPEQTQEPFTTTYQVPVSSLPPGPAGSVPPHVFVGAAIINGEAAADGTVITAFVEVPRPDPLTLEVTATGVDGQAVTATLTVDVIHLFPSGEATVTDGSYTLKVVQPGGQNFAGKTIRFFMAGQDTGQTAVWVQGDAVGLELTLGTR